MWWIGSACETCLSNDLIQVQSVPVAALVNASVCKKVKTTDVKKEKKKKSCSTLFVFTRTEVKLTEKKKILF